MPTVSLIPQLNERYRQHIDALFKAHPTDEAAALAVGGDWERVGATCFAALVHAGLQPEHSVLDIGCGSGRLADQLHGWLTGNYVGLDVSKKLVRYARKRFRRLNFEVTDGITVNAPSEAFEMVAMFSVATHIPLALVSHYLTESYRVLRPGGAAVMSFLELSQPGPWNVLVSDAQHLDQLPHLNEFLNREDLQLLAAHSGLVVELVVSGADECLTIPEHSRARFGNLPPDPVSLGQSFAILRRP